jgi:hypothetical protein
VTTKPRIVWTPTKRGFVARAQGCDTAVELVNKREHWEIRENGKLRQTAPSEEAAKVYARALL